MDYALDRSEQQVRDAIIATGQVPTALIELTEPKPVAASGFTPSERNSSATCRRLASGRRRRSSGPLRVSSSGVCDIIIRTFSHMDSRGHSPNHWKLRLKSPICAPSTAACSLGLLNHLQGHSPQVFSVQR